ncbi:low-specificity L-threonine aldolase 1-like isoform X2 [Lotus japonicus]|uniref:low-specificity L-threonine aldolase 1-like isoform X2 n=1 Tax=Lotus japonicus TaxID=34305 RepID=UPI002585F8DE|nr:low-specificity L-threonine aldolase 1-like isoform X2 [Lotus japonicus]
MPRLKHRRDKALGVPVDRLVQAADSVLARRLRKTLGGGMRQIGILCAAALVGLHENVGKLKSDHKNARTLADGLSEILGLKVDASSVESNMIFIGIEDSWTTAEKICKYLEERGILLIKESSSRSSTESFSEIVRFSVII